MSEHNVDPELKAIEQVMQALGSLKAEARGRVVAYVFERLGLTVSSSAPLPPESPAGSAPVITPSGPAIQDIRSLKNAKNPKTDNEMAALVAYYLKHLAPTDERKDSISRDEIEKYFVQADYPLPKQPQFTLTNAKNAGYFDQAGRGLYKLNPVGHNLVTHGLSETKSEKKRSRTGANKRKTRKPSRKK